MNYKAAIAFFVVQNAIKTCLGKGSPFAAIPDRRLQNSRSGGATCQDMQQLCVTENEAIQYSMAAANQLTTLTGSDDWGCLGSHPDEQWFFFRVVVSGHVMFTTATARDHDFIIYGPFENNAAALNTCGSFANPVDCSYSGTATEQHEVLNAQAGETYVLVLTNFAEVDQELTLTADEGNTAAMTCSAEDDPVQIPELVNDMTLPPVASSYGTSSDEGTSPDSSGTYAIGYDYHPHSCVRRHNLSDEGVISVQACATACDANELCLGFEHTVDYGGSYTARAVGTCMLQDSGHMGDCNGEYYNSDLYLPAGTDEGTSSDEVPESAVLCPGQPTGNYCDCHGDCSNEPLWCGCLEAQNCCAEHEGTSSNSNSGAYGDPHIKTWTGEQFDFHGICDLVLVSNAEFGKGAGLDVHIRTKKMRQWSYVDSAAIRIGIDILEVRGGEKRNFWINGIEGNGNTDKLSISEYPIQYYPISKNSETFIVDLGNGEGIVFKTWNSFVSVKVENPEKNKFMGSVGLMGSFPEGTKIGRENSIIEDINVFGQEWQVLSSEQNLFHDIEGPQHPQHCEIPSSKDMRRRLAGSLVTVEDAENACVGAGMEDKELCIFDVMATNDKSSAGAY